MSLNAIGLGMVFSARDLATGVMGKVRNGFAQTRNEMGQFGMRSKEVFADFSTGAKAMGVGLAGLAALGVATAASARFATAVAKVGTIADEAQFPLQKIQDIGFEMGRAYGGDLETQLAALYSTIGSGASTAAEATSVMHSANQLAIGGLTSVDVAMDGLMGTLNAFGMELTRSQEVADSFFQSVKLGGSDMVVGTLADALGRVAPTASALGVQLDELTGSIARMTQVGIKTAEGVTGFKAILDQIIKPSSEATAEAARLGIKLNQHSIKMAGGFEKFVMSIVSNKKFNKDTVKHLFGASSEAMNAFIALSTDNGAKFSKLMNEMRSKTGASKAAFDRLAQTPEHLAKVLKTNLQEALVKVGQAVEPLVVKLLQFATGVVQAFNAVPKPIREFAVQAFAATSAAIALVGAVASGKAIMIAAGAAARTFGLSAGAGLVSSLGPAVLIIGVVGAALYAFKRAVDLNLGGVGDAFRALSVGVRQTIDGLGQLFSQGGFSGALREEFLRGGNAFVNFAVRIYLVANRIKQFFVGVFDGFKSAADAIDFAALREAFDGLMDLFGGFKNDAASAGNAWEMFGKAGAVVGGVLGKVAGVVVSVLTAATNVVAGFAEGWDQWVAPALDVASEALGAVYDAVASTVSALGEAIGVGGDSGDLFRALGMVLANVFGGALKIVSSVVKFVANNFKALGTIVAGVVKVVVSLFRGEWGAAFDGAKQVVGGLIDYVVGGLGGMVTMIAEAIDAIAGLAGVDLGLGKRMADFTAKAKEWSKNAAGLTGGPTATPAGAPAVPGSGPGAPAPAVAAVPPPGVSSDQLFATVAAMKPGKPQVVVQPMVAPVILDGVKVGEVSLKAQQNAAAASFQPMPLSSE